jgi:hypothetical protein
MIVGKTYANKPEGFVEKKQTLFATRYELWKLIETIRCIAIGKNHAASFIESPSYVVTSTLWITQSASPLTPSSTRVSYLPYLKREVDRWLYKEPPGVWIVQSLMFFQR